MSSNCRPLDMEAIERLFDRMSQVYGVQKMSSMWAGANPTDVKRTWMRTLDKFPRAALRSAADSMGGEGGAWPPTLPEFVALVRSKAVAPEHRPALPVPKRTADEIEAGRAQMEQIKSLLGRAVKRPKVSTVSRVPGSDDEPLPPARPAACSCWTGLVRAEMLCESCMAFRRARHVADEVRGT